MGKTAAGSKKKSRGGTKVVVTLPSPPAHRRNQSRPFSLSLLFFVRPKMASLARLATGSALLTACRPCAQQQQQQLQQARRGAPTQPSTSSPSSLPLQAAAAARSSNLSSRWQGALAFVFSPFDANRQSRRGATSCVSHESIRQRKEMHFTKLDIWHRQRRPG